MKPSMNGNYSQNLHAKTEWARYYTEYARAVEIVLEKPAAVQQPLPTLPLLHSMRHVLRIAFTTHILSLKNLLDATPVPAPTFVFDDTLENLHKEFSRLLNLVLDGRPIKSATKETCMQNNVCLVQFYPMFSWLDNNGSGFPYPVQQDDAAQSFRQTMTIDFSDLVPVYNFTLTALKDTTNRLSNKVNRNRAVVRNSDFQEVRKAI
jgi:hypothetical protein